MSARGYHDSTPEASSGTSTPGALSNSWNPVPTSVSHAVTGLLRRFSSDPSNNHNQKMSLHFPTFPPANTSNGVYTPPYRNASPFQPPPLYPITLKGYQSSTASSAQLLSRALAEEIRLLVPPRLQLCEEWNLVYSLEQNGVSLGTLYKKCYDLRGLSNGFVLVVRDGEGGLFGAYLTEAPHPPRIISAQENVSSGVLAFSQRLLYTIFLHRHPPIQRICNEAQRSGSRNHHSISPRIPSIVSHLLCLFPSGTSTPERIRFKAFPYSGVNDYMMLCETGFLSVGGGDGKYGLWLDDNFERGISSHCLTFGNEPLSEEGEKFDILGVELWTIGNVG